jgi:hypothetical protein
MWSELWAGATEAPTGMREVRCPRHPTAPIEWIDNRQMIDGHAVVLPRAVCTGGDRPHGLKLPWQSEFLSRLRGLDLPQDFEVAVRPARAADAPASPAGITELPSAKVPELVLAAKTRGELEAYERRIRHGARVHRDYGIDRVVMNRATAAFYGPPGTGKTSSFGWVTRSFGSRWRVSLQRLLRPHLGETEKCLAELAEFLVALAKRPGGAAVLLDDADDVLGARGGDSSAAGKAHNGLIVGMLDLLDRAEGLVVCVTTNRLSSLDPALLRRVSNPIEFPLPDLELRRTLLEAALRSTTLRERWPIDAEGLLSVARRSEGLAQADITEALFESAINLDAGVATNLADALDAALVHRRAFRDAFSGKL